jgi:hypothetical protein
MFKKSLTIVLLISFSAFSGAGSGIMVNVGVAKSGFVTTDKDYKIATASTYSLYPIEGQSPPVPTVSLAYSLALLRPLSISAGVGFLTVGDDFKANLITSDISQYWEVDEKIRFYYLTIPLGLQAMIPIKNGGFYATFVPQLGFLISASKTIHNTAPGGTVTDTSINLKKVSFSNMKDASFSLGFRVGGEIGIRKHALFIESGYDFGLTNVQDARFHEKKVGIRTGVLTILSVGFRFSTSGKFWKQF